MLFGRPLPPFPGNDSTCSQGAQANARATPAPRLTLSPRVKQPEDERPRGSVAPRISASEPACALKCSVSLGKSSISVPGPCLS